MVSSVGYPWFALYVRSRFEKVVSRTLRDNGFTEYLPLYTKTSQWSDRTKKVELPLFPGYLFCRFDPKRTFSVLRIPSVLHIVSVGTRPAEIPDVEVETIRKLLASGRGIAPCDYLEVGQRIVVISGSLEGVEGILTRFRGEDRLVASVALLLRSVSVEIDRACVRAVQTGVCRVDKSLISNRSRRPTASEPGLSVERGIKARPRA
ncbi:MAG: UpxY family transcription antiterminator [Bryobacteraceae bacterium]|jgi:transcription antitermination factor NusG